jgi:hypothetical protein
MHIWTDSVQRRVNSKEDIKDLHLFYRNGESPGGPRDVNTYPTHSLFVTTTTRKVQIGITNGPVYS